MAAGAVALVPLSWCGSGFGRKDEGSTSTGLAPPRSPGKGSLTAAPIQPGSNGNRAQDVSSALFPALHGCSWKGSVLSVWISPLVLGF